MPTVAPKIFSSPPIVKLVYFTGEGSPITLYRVPDMTADVGANGGQFDEMLRRWVGGTGITNIFQLVDVPAGTYNLYLYTGSLVSTIFTITVNGVAYPTATATPTGASSFVQNANFVLFSNIVVARKIRATSPAIYGGGTIEIKVEGTISGLQLRRL